jgi:hypothetical protein
MATSRVARFLLAQHTKTGENILNGHKIDHMVIKYKSISHCETLRNLPKLGDFWFENIPGNPGNKAYVTQTVTALSSPHPSHFLACRIFTFGFEINVGGKVPVDGSNHGDVGGGITSLEKSSE